MHLERPTSQASASARTHRVHTVTGWGEVHVAGDVALLRHPGVAIIGARRSSHAGREAAAMIATSLAHANIVVISGLAAGIDGVAHQATMAAGGRTMAVIGTSLDIAYPKDHTALQECIAQEHLVVSPFDRGTPMSAWHFPKRNRLMARLAQGTVLIEASPKSGTRHQVTACASLGRPIFAPAHLVEALDWLSAPSVRRCLRVWREPREVVAALTGRAATC
jgi:DNA processing protein